MIIPVYRNLGQLGLQIYLVIFASIFKQGAAQPLTFLLYTRAVCSNRPEIKQKENSQRRRVILSLPVRYIGSTTLPDA